MFFPLSVIAGAAGGFLATAGPALFILLSLHRKVSFIMATQPELVSSINALTANVAKIGTETRTLLQRITDLEQAIVNGAPVSPEVLEALAALQTQVGVVDALVPDAPETPAP